MIASKIFSLYAAHGDGGERGIGPVLGYFTTNYAAKEFAHKKGWYGGDGYVSTVSAVKIGEEVYILASPCPVDVDMVKAGLDDKLKRETLAMLSPEQKRVLGLK